MKSLAGLCAAALLALACSESSQLIPPVTPVECLADPTCEIPLVSAHRGICGPVPENTLYAFLECERQGVPMVEIDTQETADGAVVIMHDDEVDRTTDGEERYPGRTRVDQLSLEEFKSLVIDDPACQPDPESHPDRCHPPSLQEILERTGEQLLLDVDFKAGDPAKLAEVIQAAGAGERVMFFDKSLNRLRAYRSVIPAGLVMPLADDSEHCQALLGSENDDLDLRWIHGTPGFVLEVLSALQAAGVRLYVNGWDDQVDVWLAAAELAADPAERQEYQDLAWEALDALIGKGPGGIGTNFAPLYAEYLYPNGFGVE